MKALKKIFAIFTLLLASVSLSIAQDANMSSSKLDGTISAYMQSKTVAGAELGMILCEDADGNKVICSGSIEETVLGVITNVPYVTINKPADASASKFVFEAKVSKTNGSISRGDYLKAVAGGNLGKCSKEEVPIAYAIALEDATDASVLVKVRIMK